MGITPRELIAQGAVANKAGTGLDNDPASFAKNAAAIMAVMEQKFGGIASAMRGSWAQMLLDMQDYWLRFTLMLSHGQGFGVLSGFLGGIRDKVAAAFDDGRAQKFADSIGAILVNLRPIGNLLLQMVDPAIDRIAAGAQVIADKIKAWMDAGKLQDFLNKALTAAAKFVPLAVQVGNFYIQLKLWSYDLRLVLGQVVAWVDVLWNKIAQGFAALRGHKAEAAGYGKAASAAEASSADFGKMRQQLVKGATIAQDYLNKGGNWTLKQIEDAQAALKNVKWNDDLQGMVKDWSSALGRAAASIRQGYKDGGEEAEESGTKAGENFADAAGKGMDKWLGGAGILDVGNFLANMKHGMSPDAAMAATKARSDAEHPSKKDSYYGTVTGVPFAKWPASAAQPTGDGGGGAPTTDAWAAQQAANEANSKRLNSQWNDAHSADPYRGMGAGEAARLGQDMNGGAGGDASSPASGGGHPNAKYWGIGGGLLAAWRVLTNLKNAVVRKLNPNASKTVEGYFKDWLLRRRGGSSGSAGEGAEAAAASSRNFAGDAAWMEQQANARRVLTGGEGGGQSAYDMNRLADLGRKRGMGRGIRGGPSGTGAEVEATETVSRFLPRILEWAGKLFKSDTSAMGMLDWGRAMDEFNKHYKGPRGFGPITPDMTFPKLLALGERQLAVLNGIYGLQHANYTGAHNAPAHSMMTVTPHTIPQTYAPRPVSQAAFTGGGNGVTHIHCTVHGVVTPQAIGHALQAALPGAFQRHDENTARAIYQ